MKLIAFTLAALFALTLGQGPSTLPPPESTTQGNDTVDPIIIHGQRAQPGEFKHHAYIIQYKTGTEYNLCGGSLIHPMVILTAAHCVDFNGGTYEVRMGGTNTNQMSYVNRPNRKTIHEGWNTDTLENDVALLFLTAPAQGQNIAVIQLAPTNSPDFAGVDMIISGFGITESGAVSQDMNKANQRAITNSQCAQLGAGSVFPSTLCTVPSTQPRQIACGGDSGGPLVVLLSNNGQWMQTGVTSFVTGTTCEEATRNGYARVSSYRPWIEANMAPHRLA